MDDSLPIWLTAQLCIVLYVAGVTFPYLFTYVSPKLHKERISMAIQRYKRQRRLRDEKERRRLEEAERQAKIQYSNALLKRGLEAYQNSSSSSSEEEEDEEEESEEIIPFIDESMKNDKATLQQYATIIDLFDGQGCTTSLSAATTIMVRAPRRAGTVLNL